MTKLGIIMLIVFGALPRRQGITGLGPGLRAARDTGTAGYYITQEDRCGHGCTWYGVPADDGA
jgi:hypothetical protein